MNLPTESDMQTVSKNPPTSTGSEAPIQINDLSLQYRMPNIKTRSFKEFAIRALQGKLRYSEFWALRNISLDVHAGEILGIIGHNGAGKSTLLKVVSRVIKPTEGRVRVVGHLAALLAVGAGFHKELTGRENIFLNGAMLGFSKQEMEEKFERIVDFAEMWDFIDQPLRTYSSGMRARLGFAVATDTKPDILIIDEILAVGDEAFKNKSAEKMRTFHDRGTTTLLVSHSMATVKDICHRVAWLHQGELRMLGETEGVVAEYSEERRKHRDKKNPKTRA